MQELEIENDLDITLLCILGFILEIENHLFKKRVGCYIRDNIKYVRRNDYESSNCHLLIIDVVGKNEDVKCIINLCRSFNPTNHTARSLFTDQLLLIKNCFIYDTVLLGDLNLDFNRMEWSCVEKPNRLATTISTR